jgi:hypothetical protein
VYIDAILPVTDNTVGWLVVVPIKLLAMHLYVPWSVDAKENMVNDGLLFVEPEYFTGDDVEMTIGSVTDPPWFVNVHLTNCNGLLVDDTAQPRVICCPVNCEYNDWAIMTTGGVPSWIEKEESTHKKHRYLMIRKWISIFIIFF